MDSGSKKNAPIKNNVLLADVECNSPSTAGWIVLGGSNNGWYVWKDMQKQPVNVYRKRK